jgi:hypothetical protein
MGLGDLFRTPASRKSKLLYMSSSGWSEISETLSMEGGIGGVVRARWPIFSFVMS